MNTVDTLLNAMKRMEVAHEQKDFIKPLDAILFATQGPGYQGACRNYYRAKRHHQVEIDRHDMTEKGLLSQETFDLCFRIMTTALTFSLAELDKQRGQYAPHETSGMG